MRGQEGWHQEENPTLCFFSFADQVLKEKDFISRNLKYKGKKKYKEKRNTKGKRNNQRPKLLSKEVRLLCYDAIFLLTVESLHTSHLPFGKHSPSPPSLGQQMPMVPSDLSSKAVSTEKPFMVLQDRSNLTSLSFPDTINLSFLACFTIIILHLY